MGSLVGHVAPGVGFVVIGLWHLINHIKLHATHPNTYSATPWFPSAVSRHLELYLIMAASTASIAMELFNHQPFGPLDYGFIPASASHLHNLEHASISLAFFAYALLSLLLDRAPLAAQLRHGLTQLLGAVAFGQQLLLFHLRSADQMGPEGQHYMLLQLVVLVSLTTTLMGIGFPKSFYVSFVRSLSIFFQGVWLVLTGFMLWTPSLIAKGCFMRNEGGRHVVRCAGEESVGRAKSLVNLQFSWLLTGIAVFGVRLYLAMVKIYGPNCNKAEYFSLEIKEDKEFEDRDEKVESLKKSLSKPMTMSGDSKRFIDEMGNAAGSDVRSPKCCLHCCPIDHVLPHNVIYD